MVVVSHVSLGIWFISLLLMSDILIFVFHGNVLEKKGMHGGLWVALGHGVQVEGLTYSNTMLYYHFSSREGQNK